MYLKSQHISELNVPVMAVTVIFILLGSFASGILSTWEPFLVLGMMLLLGLPHGATDHGLFLALQPGRPANKKTRFYLTYLSIIGAYGLIWFFLPMVAFVIFMLLSIYHFGQSNWVKVDHGGAGFARLHYLIWGAGILLTPILLHSGEAISIVQSMTGTQLLSVPERSSIYLFIGVMGLVNALVMFVLWWQQRIETKALFAELISYTLLILLFFTNSLLLGFSVYFVVWHSLASAKDQVQFFKQRLSPESRRQLYGEIGMTVLGALLFCLIVWFGPGPETALQPAIIGGVFIFISLLTLPHMLLVEELYARWSPTSVTAPSETIIKNQLFTISRITNPAQKATGKEITITQ